MPRPEHELVKTLIETAEIAARHAYARYSDFPVGAAVLTGGGEIVSGCNIENASYGLTVCAERVATWSAVASGERVIHAVAVVALNAPGVTPCGACRQVLNEFAPPDDDLWVILTSPDGREIVPLSDLLPRSFGPRDVDRENQT